MNISDKTFSKSPKISFFNLQTDSFKYEIFLKKFNDEKQNVTFRSLQFLQWRYLDIPNRKYHLLKLEANNEIEAIAVFRAKYIYGIRCGILIDLITLENLGDVKTLLNTICEIAFNNKLDLIFTTVPSHSFEFSILKKSRFYSIPQFFLPQKLAFIVKRHLPSCPDAVTNFRKWFLTFGDYDIF